MRAHFPQLSLLAEQGVGITPRRLWEDTAQQARVNVKRFNLQRHHQPPLITYDIRPDDQPGVSGREHQHVGAGLANMVCHPGYTGDLRLVHAQRPVDRVLAETQA
eukprot:360869-Pyramimonas_sp.AAC.1